MKPLVTLVSALFLLLLHSSALAAVCTVCHSKKPEMRRMHEALGYKDCFTCHGPTANPTDRSTRATDQRCLTCHKQ